MSWKLSLAPIVVSISMCLASVPGVAAPTADVKTVVPGVASSQSSRSIPTSVVKMTRVGVSCSGTVLAIAGDQTLVSCCNHCFADRPWPGGRIPRGKYPAPCTIERLSDGKAFDGIAVDGNAEDDISLVVVLGGSGFAAPEVARGSVGDTCVHYGISSGPSTGRITRYSDADGVAGSDGERSTLRSIPGDSGAGVFVNGRIVAQNWGYWNSGEQGGTPVRYLLKFARGSSYLRDRNPELQRAVPSDPTVLPLPKPPDVVPPLTPVPPCVGPDCPSSPFWSRPRLRPLSRLLGRW